MALHLCEVLASADKALRFALDKEVAVAPFCPPIIMGITLGGNNFLLVQRGEQHEI
jgi:hypothetical protein